MQSCPDCFGNGFKVRELQYELLHPSGELMTRPYSRLYRCHCPAAKGFPKRLPVVPKSRRRWKELPDAVPF